jgi:hypothetical protein
MYRNLKIENLGPIPKSVRNFMKDQTEIIVMTYPEEFLAWRTVSDKMIGGSSTANIDRAGDHGILKISNI